MSGEQPVWMWDQTSVYDLSVEIVNTFLKERFGNWHFYTEEVDGDTIRFWIPRKLSKEEKKDLKARGERVGSG